MLTNISPHLIKRVNLSLNSRDPWIVWHENLIHWVDEVMQIIFEDLNPKSAKAILDVATGTSGPLLYLLDKVKYEHVDVCDINQNYLDLGKILLAEHNSKNINFNNCKAEALLYDDSSYDLVTCLFALSYFEDAYKAIDQIKRILKPGAKAYFSTWGDYNALFELVKTMLQWESHFPCENLSEIGENSGIHKIMDCFKDSKCSNYISNSYEIHICWKGNGVDLWEFFKATNQKVELLLSGMDENTRIALEAKIIKEINKMKKGNSIKIPATINLITLSK